VDEEPEWPVAGSPPPDASPYPSVVSSANPDSYQPTPEPPPEPAADGKERRKIDRSKVVGSGSKRRASGRLSKTAPISSVYAAAQATSLRAHPPAPPIPVQPIPVQPTQVPPPAPVPPPASVPPAPVQPGRPPGPVHPPVVAVPPPGVAVPPPTAPPTAPPRHQRPPSGPPVPGQPALPYLAATPVAVPAPPVQPVYVFPEPPASKRSRASRGWLNRRVGALLAVLVLVLGAGLGYLYGWPAWVEGHATLVAPNYVIGLAKIDDPAAYSYPKRVVTQLRDAGLGTPVVAGYAASDDPAHIVVLLGGTGFLLDPDGQIDDLFVTIAKGSELPLTDVRETGPGPMGGAARCARGSFQHESTAVCGWADHGSAAILVFYNRTPEEGALLMRAIRPGVLRRTWH
jgi:hypothetical protein